MNGIILILALASAIRPNSPNTDQMCGAYTLYVGLRSLDCELNGLEELEQTLGPPPLAGYSMAELAEAARKRNYHALGVHTTLENLANRPGRFACIAHLEPGHFVLISRIDETAVHVMDPPVERSVAKDVWHNMWQGDVLLISQQAIPSESEVEAGVLAATSQARYLRLSSWILGFVVLAAGLLLWRRRLSET